MMPAQKYVLPDRIAWLEARKNHIGGSDAAACVGLSPYKDNVQLWEEKMGLVLPEDISDRDYVRYGTEAEGHLRALFAMDFPQYQVLYEENNMFLNPEYPWMHASLDGELVDPEGRHGTWRSRPRRSSRERRPSSGTGGSRTSITARSSITWL